MWKKVNRNWGYYITLLSFPFFKVKFLHFNKDAELSVQMHLHRKEFWIMLNGEYKTYLVGEVDNKRFLFVKEKQVHSFKAFTSVNVIEFQFGKLVDENDIIRLNIKWYEKN